MLELQILLNQYPSKPCYSKFPERWLFRHQYLLLLQGGIYFKHLGEILFSITKRKREVALDDFCISIQINLGTMPHTFYKIIPKTFYPLEKALHSQHQDEKFQSSSWTPDINCTSIKTGISILLKNI